MSTPWCAYALSVLLVFLEKPNAIPVIFIPLLANAVYSSRLIPGLPRLKDIPFMKNLVVAFSWASVCVLIPAAYSERLDARVLLIIYFMILKSIINTILYDVRDVAGDRENGIRTVPCLLGPKKTSLILLALNSALLPLLALTEGASRLLIGGMIVYGYVYILHFSKKQKPDLTGSLCGRGMDAGLHIDNTTEQNGHDLKQSSNIPFSQQSCI